MKEEGKENTKRKTRELGKITVTFLSIFTLSTFIGKENKMFKQGEIFINSFYKSYAFICGRRGGLMVGALDSGASGPGSSPGRGHCVVFLGKTLYSHSAFLHPGV